MMKKKKITVRGSEAIKKTTYVRRWGNQFSRIYTDSEIEKLGDELFAWLEESEKNIWFKDFLIQKRIGSQRLSEFKRKNKYFDYIYSLCKELQESKLFRAGTSKQTNPVMYLFALKSNHNWSDRQSNLPTEDVVIKIGFRDEDPDEAEELKANK